MATRPAHCLFLLSLFACTFVRAQDSPPPTSGQSAPAQPTPAQPVANQTSIATHSKKYTLTNLHPVDVHDYESNGLGADHEYLLFRNERGMHYLIYEDLRNAPTLPELRPVRNAMKKKDQICRIDLLCTLNAFCTGTCKNFYYELNNVGPDPNRPRQNHCRLESFSCNGGGAKD